MKCAECGKFMKLEKKELIEDVDYIQFRHWLCRCKSKTLEPVFVKVEKKR